MKHQRARASHASKPTPPRFPSASGLDLTERCADRLSPVVREILQRAAQTAEARGLRVYAVGGFVRDILLGTRNEDLDLTVEGDGVVLAQALAVDIGGTCKGPSAFGTAVVIAPDGHKIDVATARREVYQRPAALPTVEAGTIQEDLFRRDFSINTLAFALNGPESFKLLDYYGGYTDLQDGVIRVLHNRSFRDDPTRIFRAVRLEQRFGFVLHHHTVLLLQRAADKGWIELLSGMRLWREIRLMLQGESPVDCLRRLDELGILAHIDAELGLSPQQVALLRRVAEARVELAETQADILGHAWLVYLAALLYGLKVEAIRRICERLTLAPRTTQELIDGLAAMERACERLCQSDELRPSEVVAALRSLSPELLPLLLARCPDSPSRAQVARYVVCWRHIRPDISGDDLRRLGVPQGPAIGQLLTRVLAAKLDGEAPNREVQETLARRLMHQLSTPSASDHPPPSA